MLFGSYPLPASRSLCTRILNFISPNFIMTTIISFYYKRPIDLPTILNMYFCQSTNPVVVEFVTATLVTAIIAFSICNMSCENSSLPNGLRAAGIIATWLSTPCHWMGGHAGVHCTRLHICLIENLAPQALKTLILPTGLILSRNVEGILGICSLF